MHKAIKVKLLPTPEQANILDATLRACNDAANEVSKIARERGIKSKRDLRAVTYGIAKQIVGAAQPAQSSIRKVADAYATHRANLRAGNYGAKGTDRRAKAEAKIIAFRPRSSQPFDDRSLSWRHADRTVSIWTVEGRQVIPFTGREEDLALIAEARAGESDLIFRDGSWYLAATVRIQEPSASAPEEFLGVDLGIEKIAFVARADGSPVADWSGGAVTRKRKKNLLLRKRLQRKGTKSAKRLLKKRSGREARFATDVNHCISKRIVAEAQRTGRGIAVEDLGGIRDRVRHRKPQRATFHSWAFAQLGFFIAYKAAEAGVAFVQFDPAHTSQTCSKCGRVDRKARRSQAEYRCTDPSCGASLNADHNAAVNIARRGAQTWAAVNLPDAA